MSWNCRGAGSPETIRTIIQLLRRYNPSLLFLMEPRILSCRAKRIVRGSTFTNVMDVEARGFSGGLWCLWDATSLKVCLISYTAQVINICVSWLNESPVLISLVYASPTTAGRESFHEYVENMAGYIQIPWLLIGDFNQVAQQDDKRGGRLARGCGYNRMRRMIDTCCLIGVDFSGPRFTWTNGQPERFLIEQRLDQAWCNDLWQERFGSMVLQHLPRIQSDHHPLFVTIDASRLSPSGPKPFKFLACWMLHKDFQKFMNDAWVAHPQGIRFTIESFNTKMAEWRDNVFGSLVARRKRCWSRLEGVQCSLANRPSVYLSRLETKLLEELNDILLQEEVFWQQKNNLQWLCEGEQNSRFFHQTMANHQRGKYVSRLRNLEGNWVESVEDITAVLQQYYQNIFQSAETTQCPG